VWVYNVGCSAMYEACDEGITVGHGSYESCSGGVGFSCQSKNG
jgi:hypothetical protein